jgi:hypothetical protein
MSLVTVPADSTGKCRGRLIIMRQSPCVRQRASSVLSGPMPMVVLNLPSQVSEFKFPIGLRTKLHVSELQAHSDYDYIELE